MKATKWIVLAGVLLMVPLGALGDGSKSWTLSGTEAFSEGDLNGVSVTSTGEAVLGPPVEKIEGLEANYVWDIAVGKEDVVYVATGAPAALYAIRGGKLELLHKTSEQHVLSVLPLPDGSVLGATTPRGIIYRVDAAGDVTVFQDLDERYVWDMALGPKGDVYCATGPDGRLLRIVEGGEPEEVFKAAQSHLFCMALDPNSGEVFLGTQPGGLIYQVTAGGKATVLYDTEETEVRTLLLGPEGELYVGTAQGARGGPSAPVGLDEEESAPEAPAASDEGDALADRPSAPNSLYRILPGKGAVRLARFSAAFVLSVALGDSGEVLAGTGVEGRLVAVSPEGVTRIVTDFEAQHVSAMASDSSGVLIVGTSNGGGLWRLGRGHRKEGTFTSAVFDAGYLARWGRLWWKGTGPDSTAAAVSLRTGNAREPDETWSEWSPPVLQAAGEPVEVPMGRFAQIRAQLSTTDNAATLRLIELAASYRQVNRRPQVKNLSIDGAEPGGGKGPQPRQPRSSEEPPGQRTVEWEAADPNGDELAFDLSYRGADEMEWKELEKDLRGENEYTWDTRRVPDGHYVLRLVASDRFARPGSEALEAEKTTPPFVIDNRRPQVLELEAAALPDGSYLITGIARDGYSGIRAIEASRNSGDWVPVFPQDGIFDSPAERFTFHTDVLSEGEHVFVFAATDDAQNTGSEKVVVHIR